MLLQIVDGARTRIYVQHEGRIPAAEARLRKPMLVSVAGSSHENQPTRKQSSMCLLGCVCTLVCIHDTADTKVRTFFLGSLIPCDTGLRSLIRHLPDIGEFSAKRELAKKATWKVRK